MKRKTISLVPIFLLLITCFIIPVSAFYFDFQYFETDKLVYEVGETINMVAKLIADFSDEGWCYVTFAAVTDIGPSFADEYYISPSPVARYLNSSYTIMPDHTSPTTIGVQAFVFFTVEIFDTVYQSAGNNIEITINRGHLNTVPLSPLSIQYGLNTSLLLKIASVHNNNVVYTDELVTLHIENSNSQTVLHMNTTTTSEGMISLNWSDPLGPPGLYNLTVSSEGNEDFLPFIDSFQINVLPALSNLTIISSPESVYCQSPDGSHFEEAELIVKHTDLDTNPIANSIVEWTTSFGSGMMTNMGDGQYSDTISFNTSPGSYQINFTATNPQYQIAKTIVSVDVIANQLQFSSSQSSWNVTRGESVMIEFYIESYLDWNQSVQLQFIDEFLQFTKTTDVQINTSSSLIIPVWYNISVGQHTVNIFCMNEYYQFITPSQITLIVIGTMNANVSVETTYYGETLEFILELLDNNNQSITLANVSLFCDDFSTPFVITGTFNSNIVQAVSLPLWIPPGFHNFTFIISSQYFITINFPMSIRVWMRTNMTIVITTDGN
ncbi:MAG: hypothetical protein ACFFCX_00450 [Candidatus Sifarchaeia archaeon]